MIKLFDKSSRKGIVTGLLIIMMVIASVMPIWADEIGMPDISEWATEILNEGEKYGIYPNQWYYDGFRTGVSQEQLQMLMEATSKKIAAIGLEKNEQFTPVPSKGDGTRGDVIIMLYNILAQYDMPVGESPVEYMQERGILKGTTKGLELDKICTTEQAVVLAIRLVDDTYDLLKAASKGLAWKVEHNGNAIYLVGSIHIGSSELYPIDRRLRQAFNESDALIVEANLFSQEDGIGYYMEKAFFQDGTTLKDVLSDETYEKLVQILEVYGMPEEAVMLLKPWSLANTLNVFAMANSEDLQQGAESAGLGIDMYFMLNALLTQKPIYELEGVKYQTDLFDGLSYEFQEAYLNAILDSILEPKTDGSSDSSKLLEEWLSLWRKGDIDGFAESFSHSSEESENELTSMLFGQRDKDMAAKIIEILESEEKGTYFLVIGAGHLVKDNTVIDLLKEKGYTIEVFK